MDPSASDRTREFINGVRRKGCLTYSVSQEAEIDGHVIMEKLKEEREVLGMEKEEKEVMEVTGEKRKRTNESKWVSCLSIQDHRMIHAREILPKEEREYRIKMKARPVAPPQPPRTR